VDSVKSVKWCWVYGEYISTPPIYK
jgi:hypothetical protein